MNETTFETRPRSRARHSGRRPHPAASDSTAVDKSPVEVQQLHPDPGTGCNPRADEVQPVQSRGAAVAPEPSKEPCIERSAAAACVDEAPAFDWRGGGLIDEFFTTLGSRLAADGCPAGQAHPRCHGGAWRRAHWRLIK